MALAGPAAAAGEPERYGINEVSASLSSNQAGAHADFTTFFALNQESGDAFAKTRDIEVHLPPGMIGNPQGIPRCTVAQLGNEPPKSECPVASQVGITEVTVSSPLNGTFTEPLYNMTPPAGNSDIVARFGFYAVLYPAFINVRVDPTDYSLVASIEGAPSAAEFLEASTTLWGVPAAPSHDALRLTPMEAENHQLPSGGRPAGLPEAPFLSNPTDCSLEREISVTARSYQLPDQPSSMSAPFPNITGCSKLTFEPSFQITPTNPEAAAPTGIDATLTIPQDETPQGRLCDQPGSRRRPRSLQPRPGRLWKERSRPLPRRGKDRLGGSGGPGPGKDPEGLGLPAHPRKRRTLPLLGGHRRTRRAPKAAGRNRSRQAERSDNHLLPRHRKPRRPAAGPLRPTAPARLRRAQSPGLNAG
jgi:hypothetical protein